MLKVIVILLILFILFNNKLEKFENLFNNSTRSTRNMLYSIRCNPFKDTETNYIFNNPSIRPINNEKCFELQ